MAVQSNTCLSNQTRLSLTLGRSRSNPNSLANTKNMDITWVQQALDQAQMTMFFHLHFPQASKSLLAGNPSGSAVQEMAAGGQNVRRPGWCRNVFWSPGSPGAAQHSSTSFSCKEVKAALGSSWAVVGKKKELNLPYFSWIRKRDVHLECMQEKDCAGCYFNVLTSKLDFCILQVYLQWFFFDVDFSNIGKS